MTNFDIGGVSERRLVPRAQPARYVGFAPSSQSFNVAAALPKSGHTLGAPCEWPLPPHVWTFEVY